MSLPSDGVTVEEQLRYRYDLVPSADVHGAPVMAALGAGRYQLMTVQDFSARAVSQHVTLAPAVGHLLWLDFRGSARDSEKEVELFFHKGAPPVSWRCAGNGLQAFYLPAAAAVATQAWLVVTSEGAIPAEPLWAVRASGDSLTFELESHRPLSLADWFLPPFIRGGPWNKYGVAFIEGGRMVLPIAAEPGLEHITLDVLVSYRPRTTGTARLRILQGSNEIHEQALRMDQEAERIHFTSPCGKTRTELDWQVEYAAPPSGVWRMHGFQMTCRPGTP